MDHSEARIETAHVFLQRKGIKKVHQLNKRYNLTIGELIEFLNEFAEHAVGDYHDSDYSGNRVHYRHSANSDFVI
jgi:hypothetical protein